MKPIDFKESTKVLQKPSTMTESECNSLHVWCDGGQCVSCWKPTFKERLNILFGGKVWLGVLSGKTQPPVFVAGEHVFNRMPLKCRVMAFFKALWDTVGELFKDMCESIKNGFKIKHTRERFWLGVMICLFVGAFSSPLWGFGIACLVGFMKEFCDFTEYHTGDIANIIFAILGGACALPFAYLLHFLIWWAFSWQA